MGNEPTTYDVCKLPCPSQMDADWQKSVGEGVDPLVLRHHMSEEPEHRPEVEAKLAYDGQAIYAIFRVEDRYVRAVAQGYHGHVCRDSCVEFFFTPGVDTGLTYFNVEINCGGAMLFHYNPEGGETVLVDPSDCDRVEIAHSLPEIVAPEITEPVTWTLEFRLPFDLIEKYCPAATRPTPGARWRANLYKCADRTSHPHWLTWSPVDFPRPKFHVPECFGTLMFEE